MAVLILWALAYLVGLIGHGPRMTPGFALLLAAFALVMLAFLATASILAILGLSEVSRQPDVYSQGRAQAIWTLVLTGITLLGFIGGFVKGVQQATGLATGAGSSKPGEVLTFDDMNFRFRSPNRPWVRFDASRLNKASKLAFMRRNPEAFFLLTAERLGTRMNLGPEQFAEMGKATMQAAATSFHVTRQLPWRVGTMNGVLVETDAEVGSYQLHYRCWYYGTNGYAYQLIGYSRVEDQETAAPELWDMLSRFELIDPNRIASSSGEFKEDFHSFSHRYAVILTNSPWHSFPSMEKLLPHAEFAASVGDSCFAVIPIHLDGQKIGLDALTPGFLGLFNIAYPNDAATNLKTVTQGNLTGQQLDCSRDLNGLTFHYRFRILQGDGDACLIAVWTQRRLADAEAVFADALGRVQFLPSTALPKPQSEPVGEGERERKTEGFIFNQAGLYDSKQGEFGNALALFRAAATADPQSIYIINTLNTWQNLARPKDALAFLDTLPASVLTLPEVRANQAYLQAQASLIDQSLANYAALFATGYRSDSYFEAYVDLLIGQRQYDAALTAVQDYLKTGDSLSAHLQEARLYRLKQDLPKAISLLKDLRQQAPFNTKVATELAETLIAAGQFSEAREIGRSLLADNHESALAWYLEGRSELGLKWYREAKSSFAEAVKLAPADRTLHSYLDYVAGLLGEGDNAAIMDPLEPVPFPPVLTNGFPDTVPAGYGANFGAYYVHRILAASYVPGKEHKSTEYIVARLLDASGVSAFSTIQVEFDPLTEQIFVNDLRVIDAEGKILSTADASRCYVMDDRTSASDSQKKVLNIPVPGLQPGCQLSAAITRQQQGHLDDFPFCAHSFSAAFPVRDSVVFLHGDGHDLKYRASRGVEPAKLPDGLYWRIREPIVARWEPLQPSEATFVPMLWISDAGTQWRSTASNYLASISDRLEADAGLRSQTLALVQKLPDERARVKCLASYVQTNLIYKAIEFGRRARIPNKPSDVLGNKYGDCKDHAVLLQQMLIIAGVPAQLALVTHRGPIQKDLPSLDQFDHMVVYVPNDGAGRFLDCTSKGTDAAEAIPIGTAGQDALVLDSSNPRFISIPPYPKDASMVSMEQHLHLVNETDLAVEESLTLSGVHGAATRDYLMKIPASNRQMTLQGILGLDDAEITDLRIDALDHPGEPLRLHFAYARKKQFRRSDRQVRGVLRVGSCRPYLSATPVDNRQTPFEITIPLSVEARVLIDVPAGFEAQPPERVDLKLDPRFVTGEGSAHVDGGQLRLDFRCREMTGTFDPSDYAAYRQTMAQALAFLEREVVFRAAGNKSTADAATTAVDRSPWQQILTAR
ncbi:MAG TPA: DUF3857 domain-containing protein [Verrucomicrobiae bacterium]|nr:DUF3857 domain-containing protein [Verrucomicrobiae bacterium]